MLENQLPKKLWYSERTCTDGEEYLIWRGNDVVGFAVSKGEAEFLCRNHQEMRRIASDRSNDLRRHEIEKQRLKREVDVLVDTLQKVTAVLRKGKEREMISAKEEASAILRKFSTVHGSLMHSRGFTIVEALVALVLSFMLLTFAASVISQGIRASRIRVASEQLTMDLRMARLTAVSKRTAVDFVVSGDPVNEYQYADAKGKLRREAMPAGVRITASTTPIRFQPNGSVQGGATTVLETAVADSVLERRTIATSVLGVPRLTIDRIGS